MVDVRTPNGTALRFPVTADVENLAWNPTQQEHFVVSAEDGHVLYFDARTAASAPAGAGAAAGGKAGKKGGKGAAAAAAAGAAGAKALWTLKAHDKPTTALSFCPAVAGLLATGSTDKTVKLWDVSSGRPSQLGSKDIKARRCLYRGAPTCTRMSPRMLHPHQHPAQTAPCPLPCPQVGSVFTVSFCKDRPFLLAASGAKGTVAVWDTKWEASVQARTRTHARARAWLCGAELGRIGFENFVYTALSLSPSAGALAGGGAAPGGGGGGGGECVSPHAVVGDFTAA